MTYRPARMRFGTFIAPFHPVEENPTLALERDMQLVQLLDTLDYDEAWIGEHHSAGYEMIASPEIFMAAAAERTKRIRLGSGVNSLTYHQPLILADRFVQLDHQTRGRVMLGVGPGQIASDAFMLGIDPAKQRHMMIDSLEAILDLLEGKVVNRTTDWFTLSDARLHLHPYQKPRLEVAVAAAVTPSGPALAGRLGLSMLSVAASSRAGYDVLPEHWRICEAEAAKAGKSVHRDNWRVVIPMHIAPTRQQAIDEVADGVFGLLKYLRKLSGKFSHGQAIATIDNAMDAVKLWTTEGLSTFGVALVGSPDDAVAYIERLQEQSGGFGTFLSLEHNCASVEATRRSYDLFARFVAPRFQGSTVPRAASLDWYHENSLKFTGAIVEGMNKAVEEYRSKNG